jgi:hypothetical protein
MDNVSALFLNIHVLFRSFYSAEKYNKPVQTELEKQYAVRDLPFWRFFTSAYPESDINTNMYFLPTLAYGTTEIWSSV